ncbi:MAG: autotransporter outer membrane beta-barrel domain-containing protein [Prevotellaceae bacterium]|nr:autotransporter outer membrane beta-barrel domain-containing protein [Prevotellaceae bacterium]
MKRNFLHIIVVAIICFLCQPLLAQEQNDNEPLMPGETPKPTKYVAVEQEDEYLVFFQGFTLSADVFGLLQYAISDYGALEAALRLNLKNTYFPIAEVGYGRCHTNDFNTKVQYKVNAPYLRLGFDYNVLKDKFQDNRLYLGLRYGISMFNYNISGPAMTDPIWGGSAAFDIDGINCTSHWGEVVFGAEVKIYRNFHMSWAVRYKREFSSTKSDYAKPSCIPGYGYTTKSNCWGGSYSLIFDLNWGKKKSHKRGVKVELIDVPSAETEVERFDNEETEEQEQKLNIEDTQANNETGNSANGADSNEGDSGEETQE